MSSYSSPLPARQPSWWKKHQRKMAPWLFLAPVMFLFFVYVIAPIFQSIAISFYDWDGLGDKKWIGFSLQNPL